MMGTGARMSRWWHPREDAAAVERHHLREAAWTVGAALVAGVFLWALLGPLAGVELRAPRLAGSAATDLGALEIGVAAALVGLVGWLSWRVMERFVDQPVRSWTVLASIVMIGSLALPLWGAGLTGAGRWGLAALHLGVGGAIIWVVRRQAAAIEPGPQR